MSLTQKKDNEKFKMKLLTHSFPLIKLSHIMFINSSRKNLPCRYSSAQHVASRISYWATLSLSVL